MYDRWHPIRRIALIVEIPATLWRQINVARGRFLATRRRPITFAECVTLLLRAGGADV